VATKKASVAKSAPRTPTKATTTRTSTAKKAGAAVSKQVSRGAASRAVTLRPGDKAPAFALADQSGKTVRLSAFKGHKVLVFFYPKADTPGCTAQACGLRDVAGKIGDTQIVGISPDPSDRQKKFDTKYSLGYPLLADTEHEVASAYGVWGEKKLYGRSFMGIVRSAFLIDEAGKLSNVWYKISPKDTPSNLLAALGK
jgi:peroxiredoxin Q/BCP